MYFEIDLHGDRFEIATLKPNEDAKVSGLTYIEASTCRLNINAVESPVDLNALSQLLILRVPLLSFRNASF